MSKRHWVQVRYTRRDTLNLPPLMYWKATDRGYVCGDQPPNYPVPATEENALIAMWCLNPPESDWIVRRWLLRAAGYNYNPNA